MKKLLSLFVALIATTALWASNTITYTASQKLAEVTRDLDSGLHTDAFNAAISSHTFDNGIGTIIFVGEVTTIGRYAFHACSSLTSITIPNSVTSLGDDAFNDCFRLTSVTIPNSVTTIGGSAFEQCSGMTSVTIGNSVTSIGDYAFEYCSGLTSITIPNSVTSIGGGAFTFCRNLTSIFIPNSVTYIGGQVFYGCSGLTSPVYNANCFAYMPNSYTGAYTIPDGIKQISGGAFYECSGLISVTIPNSVISIEGAVFYNCGCLTSVTIPNSVTTIGDYAFNRCYGLTSITIGNSVATIGKEAFRDCTSLTSVSIPNSVTTIGEYAFCNCCGMTTVTIGNSITMIEKGVFAGCSRLISITCYATTPPTCGLFCFDDVLKIIPIFVPESSVDAYRQAKVWKEFTDILPISAETVPTTDEVITEPSANDVTITWPQTDNADTYTIEIKKNGELVCTLTFNNQGIMTNITFAAPARGGERTASEAEMTVNGYKFTITGLEQGTEYTYAVIAKDASAQPIQTYNGSFKTTEPTGLEDLTIDKKVGNKFIYGNQLYLRRGDKMYNATGQKVK